MKPQAVQHPTDARLYCKVHAARLRIAEAEGLDLRQSYRKLMARAFQKHGGYAKARQFKRTRKSLKTMAGRVVRDGGSMSASFASGRTHGVRYMGRAEAFRGCLSETEKAEALFNLIVQFDQLGRAKCFQQKTEQISKFITSILRYTC